MKRQVSLAGRSLIFNGLMILLNLTGLVFLVMGFHENFKDSSSLFKLIGLFLMLLSICGIIIFKGRYMMSSVARVFVGALFIVSGLVKANDPLGFSYKLEEYFEDGALAFRIKEWFGAPGFSMEFLIDYALVLSVLICIAEIVLGVMTIIGGKIKLVSYLLLFMMLFFTFLTWHTANCDNEKRFVDHDTYALSNPISNQKIELAKSDKSVKIISKTDTEVVIEEWKTPQCVSDCGCFGDALKGSVGRSLTPAESLWKDIVLLYFVVWIFMAQWITKPNTAKSNFIYTVTSLLTVTFFSWVFGWYFPVFFALISIVGSLWIVRAGGKFLGNYYGSALLVSLFSVILVTYVLMYLPMKDYRPFAVGSNLIEKMNDGVEGVNSDMLVYKNKITGDTLQFGATSMEYVDSKIWEKPDWKFDSQIQKILVPGRRPSIDPIQFNPFVSVEDVSIYEMQLDIVKEQMKKTKVNGLKLYDKEEKKYIEIPIGEYNVTDYDLASYSIVDTIEMANSDILDVSILSLITKAKKVVMVSSLNLNEGDWRHIDRLKSIFELCKKKNIPFVVVCGASRDEINAFRTKHKFNAPFFVNDGTELKIISRSNPTLMVIEKGVVKAKYPFRSTPSRDLFKSKHMK